MEKEEVRERLLYQPRFKRKHNNQPPVNWMMDMNANKKKATHEIGIIFFYRLES